MVSLVLRFPLTLSLYRAPPACSLRSFASPSLREGEEGEAWVRLHVLCAVEVR